MDSVRKPYNFVIIKNGIKKLFVTVVVLSVALIVVYFTPVPQNRNVLSKYADQNFKSCDRPCHELDWPMICRVKLNIEMYHTKNHVCQDCRKNSTTRFCTNIFCDENNIESNRGIITANRQLPGPAIQVCENDIMIVDVINKIPGRSLTMHWRGQPNGEAPFMDGVPMITQCPVPSFTTFQYKFRASAAGTHFYHAFADSDRSNGLFGALIVRKADKIERHRKLYDIDSKEHVILISEWSGDISSHVTKDRPTVLLINGRAPSEIGSALSMFHVSKGKRYRFRVAYTGGITGCPITVILDKHLFKVIALDGNPIKPYDASSFQLGKGERLDFVLKANQAIDGYLLKVQSSCDDLTGIAVVNYNKYKTSEDDLKEIYKMKKPTKVTQDFNTVSCEKGSVKGICINEIQGLDKVSQELGSDQVDKQLFLEFDFKHGEHAHIYGTTPDLRSKIYRVNNFTFTYPSSPILTQPWEISMNVICNEMNVPAKCVKKSVCECVHLEKVDVGNTVEIILINQGGDQEEHVFHLHGHHFYIVGTKIYEKAISKNEIQQLDKENKFLKRNLLNPVSKDTVRVPKYGVVVLRFVANNPGFWMLRDEKSGGWTRGLDMILQVGNINDMTPTPSNFPQCGSYVGPDFFLL